MPVKIRLMRIGATKRPFYRVVAVDERKKRTGTYLELLGTYNPLTEPKEIIVDQNKVEAWVKKGAQLSTGYLRIIGKAPQRPPRKPKKIKETPAPAPAAAAPKQEEAPQAENQTSEENKEGELNQTQPEVEAEVKPEETSSEAV